MCICKVLNCELFDGLTDVCKDDKRFINAKTNTIECRYCTQAIEIHREKIEYFVIEESDKDLIISQNYKHFIIAQGECRKDKFKEIIKGIKYVGKLILTDKEFYDLVDRNDTRKELIKSCR